jgi:hypothetical protein
MSDEFDPWKSGVFVGSDLHAPLNDDHMLLSSGEQAGR